MAAAARVGDKVAAVVSRGGRPELADTALTLVRAPTLLIVGSKDVVVIELNEEALVRLTAQKALRIVSGASHLFSEPGALEAVIALATDWFTRHLRARAGR